MEQNDIEDEVEDVSEGERKRAIALKKSGYTVTPNGKFAKGTKPGPGRPKGSKTRKTVKEREFNLFKVETKNLEAFRDCAGPNDIKDLYDRILKDALGGKVKAQELMMQYLLGIPPKVMQVQSVNVNDILSTIMTARAQQEESDVDAEYEVIDGVSE